MTNNHSAEKANMAVNLAAELHMSSASHVTVLQRHVTAKQVIENILFHEIIVIQTSRRTFSFTFILIMSLLLGIYRLKFNSFNVTYVMNKLSRKQRKYRKSV